VGRAFLRLPVDYSRPFDSPDDFLPLETVKMIAKHIRDLENANLIHQLIGEDWKYWNLHGTSLAADLLRVRKCLLDEVKVTQTKQKTRAEVVGEASDIETMEQDEEDSQGEEMDDNHGSDELEEGTDTNLPVQDDVPPEGPRPQLFIRIPPRNVNRP
jgi:hypothetical protein